MSGGAMCGGTMCGPVLSVVTVVRDDRAGLIATHAALRAQSWRGFEWIVVDGASSDGTAAWLAAHAGDAAWWRSAPDSGIYDAMNVGMARATGRHLLFLNAGDGLPGRDTLERIAAALAESPDTDFLYGDALERMEDGRVLLKPARSHRCLAYGMFTHHQAMVYRRALVADLRYATRYAIAADYDFTARALARARRVTRVRAPLCVFDCGGLSRKRATLGRREQDIVRRERLRMGPLPRAIIAATQQITAFARENLPMLHEKGRFRAPKDSFLHHPTPVARVIKG